MAQTKQAAKKPASKTAAKTTKTRKKSPPPPPPKSPMPRVVGTVLCFFFGIFGIIGFFDVDAWLITYFCGFVKGIIGWGYYVFPAALFICAWVLGFSRDVKPAFRVSCALLAPVFLGAVYHLFSYGADWELSKAIFKQLYTSGMEMTTGGVVSGILALLLKPAVSIYGALPVFAIGFIFFAMNSLGYSVPRLIEIYREKRAVSAQRAEYYAAQRQNEYKAQRKREPVFKAPAPEPPVLTANGRRRRVIDIPVDEVQQEKEEYVPEKSGFFNTKPRVKTPDQLLAESHAPETAEIASAKRLTKAAMPTDNIQPLSVEEAAVVAGIADTVTAEISSASSKYANESSSNTATAASKKISREEVEAETQEIAKTIEKSLEDTSNEYEYPPITLLKSGSGSAVDGREEIALNRDRLESTIRSFGVSASITGVTRGPTVTRYDLELEQGVKLAKLTNLAGDLALSLGVASVRIAPIPDKISTVGVEVPNKIVSTVLLRDIIDSPPFKAAQSKLSFAIGKDIGGNAIVGNISKLPHLLIAGTTGSGKSVCMNSLILSLLFKSTPEEVRLIMIDPKMVELGIYNGIPHLFVPVVTDPKKAAGALQWAVVEMLKRYRLFSEVGVRDLAGYNAHQKSIGEQTMPRVVIVIDELADLMLVAAKEVEESICRVAQMGRASGMHLVIATQRPSADVITGLMKANIPSRIAFAVSSAMESRIILDNSGAEKLIGAGDMLYAPLGAGKPMRVQGAYVSDEEREQVINFVKEGAEVEYSEDILAQIEKAAEAKSAPSDNGKNEPQEESGSEYDPLLPQAVDVIFETQQASVSMLQRRLRLGYSRAARIVDQMEEIGVVGPFEGSKPRQIMITKQQWQEMQTVQGTAPVEKLTDEVSFSEFEDAPAESWKD